MSRTFLILWAIVAGSSCLLSVVRGDEPAALRVNTILINDVDAPVPSGKAPENAPQVEGLVAEHLSVTDGVLQQSKYWIGLGCELATDALKSQLGLIEKQALLVTMVAENSPAKAAGFLEHDVITTVKLGDEAQPLDSVATLTAMVVKAETKPLVLSVIRRGKPQEIIVTPAERPQPSQDFVFLNAGNLNLAAVPSVTSGNPERVQQLLRELQIAVSGQPQPTTIHFTGPVVAPPVAVAAPAVPHIVVMAKSELPENVTITITKTGKEPVRIKYQTGENHSWGATEKEIHTLPVEGRTALQGVLTTLHSALPHSWSSAWGVPPGVGVPSTGPARMIYRAETIKGQGVNSNSGVTGTVKLEAATPKVPMAKESTTRLEALEKEMQRLQQHQQDLMTKQQETLRKELQSLREALEKAQK